VSDLSIAAAARGPLLLTREMASGRPVPGASSPEQARAVAQDFEAIFLGLLLKGLRATVPPSEAPSHMGQMYRDLFDEQLAVELARKGGIGLAGLVATFLERAPAAPGGPAPVARK
jgi:flagellar protein FlgJ